MSFQQLFKVTVMQGRMECGYKGRFPSILDALVFYTKMGRVIEIKEVSR